MVLQRLVDMMRRGPTGITMCARTPNKFGMIDVLEEMHCDKEESLESPSDFWVGTRSSYARRCKPV